MSKFRVVLKDAKDEAAQLASGSHKPVSFFAPTLAQAVSAAKRDIKGKPAGCFAEIYETKESLVMEITQ